MSNMAYKRMQVHRAATISTTSAMIYLISVIFFFPKEFSAALKENNM